MIVVDREELSIWYGPGWPEEPVGVMIHSTRSGLTGRLTLNGHDLEAQSTYNWFKSEDSRASSNIIISPRETIRAVPDDRYAWHAKEHSYSMYSIEVTQALPHQMYWDEQYQKAANVTRKWCNMSGIPKVYIPVYEPGMKGITGHEDSTQGRRDGKSDPGSEWDWPYFMWLVKKDYLVAPAPAPTTDKAIVWHNGFTYAERWGHHWYLGSQEVVQRYLVRGWPDAVARAPRGSRLDL